MGAIAERSAGAETTPRISSGGRSAALSTPIALRTNWCCFNPLRTAARHLPPSRTESGSEARGVYSELNIADSDLTRCECTVAVSVGRTRRRNSLGRHRDRRQVRLGDTGDTCVLKTPRSRANAVTHPRRRSPLKPLASRSIVRPFGPRVPGNYRVPRGHRSLDEPATDAVTARSSTVRRCARSTAIRTQSVGPSVGTPLTRRRAARQSRRAGGRSRSDAFSTRSRA